MIGKSGHNIQDIVDKSGVVKVKVCEEDEDEDNSAAAPRSDNVSVMRVHLLLFTRHFSRVFFKDVSQRKRVTVKIRPMEIAAPPPADATQAAADSSNATTLAERVNVGQQAGMLVLLHRGGRQYRRIRVFNAEGAGNVRCRHCEAWKLELCES